MKNNTKEKDPSVSAPSGKERESERVEKLTIDQALSEFKSDAGKGLSGTEVSARREKYGYNEITTKETSALLKLLKNFWGPIPWMIEIAVILSAINRDWEDMIIIGALLLINVFIEFFQERKAGNAIAALKKRLASTARVLRDGTFSEVVARELVPGDIIRIRLGDIIPADVKLIDGDYLKLDQSALTGESLPVDKHIGEIAYSGAIAKQGEMNALVFGIGVNTFFGKTTKLVAQAKTESHFQQAVVRIGDYLIGLNFVLVSIVILTGLIRNEEVLTVIKFALVLTVASIPAALPAVLSVTLAVGAQKLSKKKAIISKLVAIEELAGMDILCSDKTGTLTQNKLAVAGIHPMEGFAYSDIIFAAVMASKEEDNDPLDLAIIASASEQGDRMKEKIAESRQSAFTPFDPVSKRTEAEVREGEEVFKVSKGAPQMILKLTGGGDDLSEKVNRIIEESGEKGFRTVGVARTDREGKWQYVGVLALSDPPREDSAATIKAAREMGVEVKMVTGDHTVIARQISGELNLSTDIVPAVELQQATDRKARSLVTEAGGFSEVFPEDKYEIVELLQESGHITGMTGDGVNDAPALKKADCGIAVDGATDAAKSAADIVLTLPGLSVIIDAIKESRMIFQRMQSYAIYRISETIDVLFFTVLAILIFGKYPVNAVMIVLLAVFNDFPIMAIANDNVTYSPRPEQWKMRRVITVGSLLGFTNVFFTFLVYLIGKDFLLAKGYFSSIEQVKTLVFAELAVAGNMTVFLARCRGPFWKIMPGKGLIWSSLLSKIFVSALCGFGFLMAPIGWWVAVIWVYAALQMLVTDRMKLFAYDIVEHEDRYADHHHHRKTHGQRIFRPRTEA